jgi:hypothetical protein
MAFDRMAFDRMAFDRMAFDRMFDDRMGAASNRIHSMRNPPAVFNPDDCLRDAGNVLKSQKMLRLR